MSLDGLPSTLAIFSYAKRKDNQFSLIMSKSNYSAAADRATELVRGVAMVGAPFFVGTSLILVGFAIWLSWAVTKGKR